MPPVVPRNVNSVSYVTRISHDSHFAWQAQYLVMLELPPVVPRIVNSVSYVMLINHEFHFAWQAQYLVRSEGECCCAAHCK